MWSHAYGTIAAAVMASPLWASNSYDCSPRDVAKVGDRDPEFGIAASVSARRLSHLGT